MQQFLFHCDNVYRFYITLNQTVSSFFWDARYIYAIYICILKRKAESMHACMHASCMDIELSAQYIEVYQK
jgi:hypothetical protein